MAAKITAIASAVLVSISLLHPALSENTTTNPVPRLTAPNWFANHSHFLELALQGNIDLLFLGDSITDGWRVPGSDGPGGGLEIWNKTYAPRHAANFGIGGDRTENVLWRLDQGEVEGLNPKVIVLMIGTNNTGTNEVPEIVEGVEAIIKRLRAKMPKSKVLLLAIFPRSERSNDPLRQKIQNINSRLALLDDGQCVNFLDIGGKFLQPDGTLTRDVMPDFLHPNPKGYQIWADANKFGVGPIAVVVPAVAIVVPVARYAQHQVFGIAHVHIHRLRSGVFEHPAFFKFQDAIQVDGEEHGWRRIGSRPFPDPPQQAPGTAG